MWKYGLHSKAIQATGNSQCLFAELGAPRLISIVLSMKIKTKTADELNKLLDALALEIVDANIYHQLHKDLVDSRKEHAQEFAQSNSFWSLTFGAFNDARTVRLCRIFDQKGFGERDWGSGLALAYFR